MLRATNDARQLVVDVLSEHGRELLATARRHSLCADDAQDAYQVAVEIFLKRAEELDEDLAFRWLHVCVKHEAMRLRTQRLRTVGDEEESDLDSRESWVLRTTDENIASFDLMTRSAEALQTLKPHERRALWLRAQGHSYHEIASMTDWSYTKVNRLISEGRRSFLQRYADIATGAECRRWEHVLSAMVDGEASAKDLAGARPHLRNCPGCRQRLRVLREGSAGMAAVFGAPALAASGEPGEPGLIARVFDAVYGPIHDRFAASAVKLQSGIEAAMPAKAAAVAASAVVVAGGGVAVEQAVTSHAHQRPPARQAKARPRAVPPAPPALPGSPTPTTFVSSPAPKAPGVARAQRKQRARLVAARRAAARRAARRRAAARTRSSEFAVQDTSSSHASATTAQQEFHPAPAATPVHATPAPITAPPNATQAERTAAAEFGG